jgi:hypothetical protein
MTDKQTLREFLLGGLEPKDADALEGRMFADDAMYQEMDEEREALVEAYLDESLTGKDAARFERQQSLSPELAAQVIGLRDLKKLLHRSREQRGSGAVERGSIWRPLPVAMTACLLALVLLSCLQWRENRRLHTEFAEKAKEPQAGTKSLPLQSVQGEGIVFLAAAVVRGPQGVPLVEIAHDTSLVQLQIELPKEETSARNWDVAVGRNGQETFRCTGVFARRAGPISYLPVYLPAESLPDGAYQVRIRSTDPGQREESRTFTVRHELSASTALHGSK